MGYSLSSLAARDHQAPWPWAQPHLWRAGQFGAQLHVQQRTMVVVGVFVAGLSAVPRLQALCGAAASRNFSECRCCPRIARNRAGYCHQTAGNILECTLHGSLVVLAARRSSHSRGRLLRWLSLAVNAPLIAETILRQQNDKQDSTHPAPLSQITPSLQNSECCCHISFEYNRASRRRFQILTHRNSAACRTYRIPLTQWQKTRKPSN